MLKLLIIIYFIIFLLNNIINHNLFKGLKGLFELYIIIIMFLYCLFYMFEKYPLYLNIIIFCILMIGLIFDSRLLKSRYVCFLFLILIQILVYYYLDLVPLLIIKDIFWFTAIINVSVIIHLFLFEWLLNLFKWLNYDFGVYYITRISLLTSLCSIHIYI